MRNGSIPSYRKLAPEWEDVLWESIWGLQLLFFFIWGLVLGEAAGAPKGPHINADLGWVTVDMICGNRMSWTKLWRDQKGSEIARAPFPSEGAPYPHTGPQSSELPSWWGVVPHGQV